MLPPALRQNWALNRATWSSTLRTLGCRSRRARHWRARPAPRTAPVGGASLGHLDSVWFKPSSASNQAIGYTRRVVSRRQFLLRPAVAVLCAAAACGRLGYDATAIDSDGGDFNRAVGGAVGSGPAEGEAAGRAGSAGAVAVGAGGNTADGAAGAAAVGGEAAGEMGGGAAGVAAGVGEAAVTTAAGAAFPVTIARI